GPRLAGMQDLSEIATMGMSAAEILRRRMEQAIPDTSQFNLMATIEALPFTIAKWRIDLDPEEGSQSILEAIGYWLGRATPFLVTGMAALGYVVGRDIAIPFLTSLMRGLADGIGDLVWGTLEDLTEDSPFWQGLRRH